MKNLTWDLQRNAGYDGRGITKFVHIVFFCLKTISSFNQYYLGSFNFKINNHKCIDEYRPISVIWCLYKIVSKDLANKIKTCDQCGDQWYKLGSFKRGTYHIVSWLHMRQKCGWMKREKKELYSKLILKCLWLH